MTLWWSLVWWTACAPVPEATPPEAVAPPAPQVAARTPVLCERPGQTGCFVRIEGGTFHRGAQATDPDAPGFDPAARPDEGPVRSITLHPFLLMKHEVSEADHRACVDAGACDAIEPPDAGSVRPSERSMARLSWHDAQAVCTWMGGTLPTEAQWEFAARGPEGRRFPWGSRLGCAVGEAVAPMGGSDPTDQPIPPGCERIAMLLPVHADPTRMPDVMTAIRDVWVPEDLTGLCASLDAVPDDQAVTRFVDGLAQPPRQRDAKEITCEHTSAVPYADQNLGGASGLVGMGGNLAEWVADAYEPDAYAHASPTDPVGPTEGETRVQRGGGWLVTDPLDFRAAARTALPPSLRLNDVGARCAAPIPSAQDAHGH